MLKFKKGKLRAELFVGSEKLEPLKKESLKDQGQEEVILDSPVSFGKSSHKFPNFFQIKLNQCKIGSEESE